jgi:hypothetical protein
MSDFKFSCPGCGQHLSGDLRYAGLQILCPACQRSITVPAGPGPALRTTAAAATGAHRPIAVAMPAAASTSIPSRMAPTTRPKRTSGLAIASLVCSIGSFVIIPFGFIPGIICGHIARKRLAQDPTLGGRGMAKAGLIVGYAALVINVLALAALAAFFTYFARVAKQITVTSGQSPPVVRVHEVPGPGHGSRGSRPEVESGPADTTPDAAGWNLQLAGVSTPSGPVTGRIKGRNFNSEKALLENGWLKFRQGADFFADLEMNVVLFVSNNAQLAGKTFTVPKKEFGSNPHIWMKWKPAEKDVPEQKAYMEGYAMQLEFGSITDGKLPGKIYLCLPDAEKSFIRGTFEVSVNPGSGPAVSRPTRKTKK